MTARDPRDPWLDALAGGPGEGSRERREGAAARRYFAARRRADAAPGPDAAASERRVLNLLRAKGAFADPAPARPAWRERLARWFAPGSAGRGLAVAMVLVLLATPLALRMLLPDDGSAPGDGGSRIKSIAIVTLPAERPEATAQALAGALTRAGVAARVVARGEGVHAVEAQVEDAQRPAAAAALAPYGLALPAGKRLTVNVVPR